jgi:hypothetical protein
MTSEKTAKFATSCGTCIFAEYKDDKQIGCDLGRLKKFEAKGKVKPDPTNTFSIIQTICNTVRGTTWANNHLGQNLIAAVEQEIKIDLDFVLFSIEDSSEKIMKQMPELVNLCVQQKHIKPKNIICVVKNRDIRYRTLYSNIQDITSIHDIPFQLVNVIDEESDIFRCIDMGVSKCHSRYFSTFTLTDNIPSNLISVLNTKINVDLQPIILVEPYVQFSGMVLQTSLYKLFGKNHGIPIFEKIREEVEIQENKEMAITWEQLWNHQK